MFSQQRLLSWVTVTLLAVTLPLLSSCSLLVQGKQPVTITASEKTRKFVRTAFIWGRARLRRISPKEKVTPLRLPKETGPLAPLLTTAYPPQASLTQWADVSFYCLPSVWQVMGPGNWMQPISISKCHENNLTPSLNTHLSHFPCRRAPWRPGRQRRSLQPQNGGIPLPPETSGQTGSGRKNVLDQLNGQDP